MQITLVNDHMDLLNYCGFSSKLSLISHITSITAHSALHVFAESGKVKMAAGITPFMARIATDLHEEHPFN